MSMELIKELRTQTGAGIADIKKAIDAAGGDAEKALDELRKRGAEVAQKKAGREAGEGVIASYIHMDKIGVLVELNCETDFVARTEEFQNLGKDIAMQVASMMPQYVSAEEVPADVIAKEREIAKEQIEGDKPADVVEKILDGKAEKFVKEITLMNQKFFKNDEMTVEEVLNEAIGKLGENIQVKRFVRYQLGE